MRHGPKCRWMRWREGKNAAALIRPSGTFSRGTGEGQSTTYPPFGHLLPWYGRRAISHLSALRAPSPVVREKGNQPLIRPLGTLFRGMGEGQSATHPILADVATPGRRRNASLKGSEPAPWKHHLAADLPSPASGRRWRAAPDEGVRRIDVVNEALVAELGPQPPVASSPKRRKIADLRRRSIR